MNQQTAALPLDRRWQIDRCHAAGKFGVEALTTRHYDVTLS
jgi:hypothetical protein